MNEKHNVDKPQVPRATRPNMSGGYGILPAEEGSGLLPWSWVSERMQASRNYWIATTRPNGAPHVMPVWGVWIEERFYFGTDRRSRKARNLAHDPRLVVHLESGDEVVILEGTAQEITDKEFLTSVLHIYQKKYDMPESDESFGESPFYVVEPKTVFGFLENDFIGSATRWTFD